MSTLRPQNWCSRCEHTWYPRGSNRSASCPNCGSRAVNVVVPRPPRGPGVMQSCVSVVVVLACVWVIYMTLPVVDKIIETAPPSSSEENRPPKRRPPPPSSRSPNSARSSPAAGPASKDTATSEAETQPAKFDELYLKDGRVLRGKALIVSPTLILFRWKGEDGVERKQQFKRAEVKFVLKDSKIK